MSYTIIKAPDYHSLAGLINQAAVEGLKPLFITPVNEIDQTGMELDANRRPKRYFYFLATLEKADIPNV